MAKIYRLIDGYNLMHAAGMARQQYGPGDLERCRNQFIKWVISQLTVHERRFTTLVFDAETADKSWIRKLTQEGLHILYAPPGSDADSLIEELIQEHSAPRQVHVISSDHRLHKAARRRKCQPSDSEDFMRWLAERELTESAEISQKKPAQDPSEAEVDSWLKEFGEIPEAGQIHQNKPDIPFSKSPAPPRQDPSEKHRPEKDWIQRLQDEIDFS